MGGRHNVKVVVRCRPLNDKELGNRNASVVDIDGKSGTIAVRHPSGAKEAAKFTFDAAFGATSKQRDIYDTSAAAMVDAVLEGYNGTIFAYGQTGTGKTHTMTGEPGPEHKGIIPNAFDHIFGHIEAAEGKQFLVSASYLEIYMENVHDLLSRDRGRSLRIRQHPDKGVYVEDLSSIVVKGVEDIEKVMVLGGRNRSVGVTDMNAHSSRSHAIFIVTVECSEVGPDGEEHIRSGKLNLVDLAGSERQSKTNAEGQRFREATKINLSLSCLGKVISDLVEKKPGSHIPYRDSALTWLLQDSLGGNAKTLMVATVGPADYNYDETVNTLRYANRAKSIKNKPKINEDPKDAMLRQYQEEIARLKAMLEKRGGGGKKKSKRRSKKKKTIVRKQLDDGTWVEEEAYEDMEDVEEVDDEEEKKRIREEAYAKLEAEKQAMLADQSIVKEEKERLLAEMKERELQMRREEQQAAALIAKIQAMEGNLLIGGKHIQEHTAEQEAKLKAKQRELQEHARREEELQQALRQREGERIEAQDSYKSLKQQRKQRLKKFQQLKHMIQDAEAEREETEIAFAQAREELEDEMEKLRRNTKLKRLIIENFIPPEEAQRVESMAVLNENDNIWYMSFARNQEDSEIAKRPLSAYPTRCRAITDFAKLRAAADNDPRYRPENIVSLDLDVPDRTTSDYTGPALDARVQAALDDALADEGEEMVVDQPTGDFLDEAMRKAKREEKKAKREEARGGRPKTGHKKRPKTSKSRKEPDPDEVFPTARGLVRDR